MPYQHKIHIESLIYDEKKLEKRMEGVGARIKEERLKRNISISKLAELSNLSLSCISKAESHCRIGLKALLKIAAALEIPAGQLLGHEGQIDTDDDMK